MRSTTPAFSRSKPRRSRARRRSPSTSPSWSARAAEVTRGDEIKIVRENESIYLPIGVVHRLANPGKINLELSEVRTGSHLGDDAIVRIEDVYERSV